MQKRDPSCARNFFIAAAANSLTVPSAKLAANECLLPAEGSRAQREGSQQRTTHVGQRNSVSISEVRRRARLVQKFTRPG
jgi:hypothetical protein